MQYVSFTIYTIQVKIYSGKDPLTKIDESDYVGALLRDPNSSRLLEIITTRCPDDTFDTLWKTYFKGKLPRLATHPAANFVVAKAIERLSEVQLSEACNELENTWNRVIRKFYATPYFRLIQVFRSKVRQGLAF
jgi:hypothetical protein